MKKVSEIQRLFNRVCEVYNFNTKREINPDKNSKDYYLNSFYVLDFNSYYGGYIINLHNTDTSVTNRFGISRRSKKEMISFLQGLLIAKNI